MLEVCFLWTISTITAHHNILWNSDICIKRAFYHIFWAAAVGNRLEFVRLKYVRSSFYFLMFFYSSRSSWLSHAKSVVLVFIFYCASLLCRGIVALQIRSQVYGRNKSCDFLVASAKIKNDEIFLIIFF